MKTDDFEPDGFGENTLNNIRPYCAHDKVFGNHLDWICRLCGYRGSDRDVKQRINSDKEYEELLSRFYGKQKIG